MEKELIGVFEVENGKIVKEHFFTTTSTSGNLLKLIYQKMRKGQNAFVAISHFAAL